MTCETIDHRGNLVARSSPYLCYDKALSYACICILYREKLAHRVNLKIASLNGKTMVPLRPRRYNSIYSLTDMLEISEA